MKTAKIIIGANFGDEGKGLMTDYFSEEARTNKESCLVVCHNGGCQKGHTVVSPSGIRHVYHHFGSGTMTSADTYLANTYIVNPIIFNKELAELKRKGIATKIFINKDAVVTTPFDMMINQIVEEYRGESKHGSCGLGIYETILRNLNCDLAMTINDLSNLNILRLRHLLNNIAEKYMSMRLEMLGVKTLPLKWITIVSSINNIIENYIKDFTEMIKNIEITTDNVIDKYNYVIFEGSQGLLLDQNNKEYIPHLTPSDTGIKNPMRIIGDRKVDIEVCYVTRTYMTRHGKGRFDSECLKEDINPKIVDLTNIPNQYQDTIRYGHLGLNELEYRIKNDLGNTDVKKSLAITHCNEYQIDKKELSKIFNDYKIYFSDGMTRNDIT